MERIVFLDRGTLKGALRAPGFAHEWREYDTTSPEETLERLKGAMVAVTNKVPLRQAVLAQLPDLKMIAVVATGFDCVDAEYCRTRGIVVANVPDYARISVAEHVLLLMLALRRNLVAYQEAVRDGRWSASPYFTFLDFSSEDIQGTTLGLVGYGAIAKEVEKRARAFDMRVVVSERKGASSVRSGRISFEQVLRESDIISLHAPVTRETRGMIGVAELAQMKRGSLLINTARGALVDEEALLRALKEGSLGGAGLDVLKEEPPRLENPMVQTRLPNLIITPHVAWSSRQAVKIMGEELVKNIEAFVAGKPRNVVNA
jgi:glycerate dehydrogenase